MDFKNVGYLKRPWSILLFQIMILPFVFYLLYFSLRFSPLLTRQADEDFKRATAIHVRSYLDEFANVGEIPDFAEQTSTVSSWNMSLVPILQNIAQLFLIYWEGNSGDKTT